VLAVAAAEGARAAVEQVGVGRVPVLHDLRALVDLPAQFLGGDVLGDEHALDRLAQLLDGQSPGLTSAPRTGASAQETLATVLGYVGAAVTESACRHVRVDRSAIGTDGMIIDPHWQYDVSVAGDLGGHLGDPEAAELLQRIAAAAQAVADTGQEQPVAFGGAQLRVLPPGTAGYELRGGVQTSQGWPRVERRLLQKAAQAARAGGGWLRADLMDGTWQFTPWARASLREKVDQIAELLKSALCQVDGITRVVASSGACVAQGQFHGESARTPDHCYGFVRPLPGARVRETMIIPVSPGGRDEADLWAGLYNSEDSWLDWALGQARLPGCRQVFGR
jgi:hypothetical protein